MSLAYYGLQQTKSGNSVDTTLDKPHNLEYALVKSERSLVAQGHRSPSPCLRLPEDKSAENNFDESFSARIPTPLSHT
jgi:hypothetical protein